MEVLDCKLEVEQEGPLELGQAWRLEELVCELELEVEVASLPWEEAVDMAS